MANILDGDAASEGMLNGIGFPPVLGKRNPLVESAFEYGSRVGVWRVLRIFAKFDIPHEEGAEHPRLMSIGLHDRLIGRPARAAGLIKFLDYVRSFERVWFCRGSDIARHWREVHPYTPPG